MSQDIFAGPVEIPSQEYLSKLRAAKSTGGWFLQMNLDLARPVLSIINEDKSVSSYIPPDLLEMSSDDFRVFSIELYNLTTTDMTGNSDI